MTLSLRVKGRANTAAKLFLNFVATVVFAFIVYRQVMNGYHKVSSVETSDDFKRSPYNEPQRRRTLSNEVHSAIHRTHYTNLITGEKFDLEGREIQYKELDERTSSVRNFFYQYEQIEWYKVKAGDKGSRGVRFSKKPSVVESGIMEIEPEGIWSLHWHKETEHYFIFAGKGIFTVGDQERIIDACKNPTLIEIPGNVPHQIVNPFDKVLKIYYYFPEGDRLDSDITYWYPDGTKKEPGEQGKDPKTNKMNDWLEQNPDLELSTEELPDVFL